MAEIRNATLQDVFIIKEIAEKTWWPTYSSILAKEQLQYMLDLIYSAESLKEVMNNKSQHFIILSEDEIPVAFASYGMRPEDEKIGKLHKLYALPETQGKGYGKLLIEEVKSRLYDQNVRTLDLNVNRFNKAKSFYEKAGFTVLREEDVPIGPYWMNDYVMRLNF
jgi:GNAT superfamily N-acetyltransferase